MRKVEEGRIDFREQRPERSQEIVRMRFGFDKGRARKKS